MCSRVSLPESLEPLLKSEMEHCIEQANLGRYDTMIAKRYLIDQWAQIEIAAELGWNRTTVSKRIPQHIANTDVLCFNTARPLFLYTIFRKGRFYGLRILQPV